MRRYTRSLLIFSEVSTCEEAATGSRRVYEEEWRVKQFNQDAAVLALRSIEEDALDVGERVLDLVPSLLGVDIIGHGALVGRIENNQIHGTLADPGP